MNWEKDLIMDFVQWLSEKKSIELVDITGNKDRFVTGGSYPCDFTELESIIDEYSEDVDV
jgi:hypothetical protein